MASSRMIYEVNVGGEEYGLIARDYYWYGFSSRRK